MLTNARGQEFLARHWRTRPLLSTVQIDAGQVAHEHGLTVPAQTLAATCPDLDIIPFALRQNQEALSAAQTLGQAIARQPRTLLLISSDFSHHGDLSQTLAHDAASLRTLQSFTTQTVVNDTFVSPATFAAGIHNDCAACWYAAWGYFGRAPRFSLVANRNSTDYGGAESEITSYVTGWFW